MVTPGAQGDESGVGRKRFEYPHGALPTEDAHLRGGEAGVSLLAETPVVPTPYSGETDGVLIATASRHPTFMANELDNRLAGEAGFPSPKGGDILLSLLETRQRPRLVAAVGEERPWRKPSANSGDRHVPADAPTTTSAQTSARTDLEAIVVLGPCRDGGGGMGRSREHTNVQ